jgi:hypothetical protein
MQQSRQSITWADTMLKRSLIYIIISITLALAANVYIWHTLDSLVEEMKADGTLQTR